MKKLLSIALLLCIVLLPMGAQVVYECNFEDAVEVAQWQLNTGVKGPACPNKWYIGEVGNFSQNGHNGLYISSLADSSAAVYSSQQQSAVVAQRSITLSSGNYYISLDWRAMGQSSTARLLVFWMPNTQNAYSNHTGPYSNQLAPYLIATLSGSAYWTPTRIPLQVNSATEQGKLVLIWSCGQGTEHQPAACVDNIAISASGSRVAAPTNFEYNRSTHTISWQGVAACYELRDYCHHNGTLVEYTGITGTSMPYSPNSPGMHTLMLRSKAPSTGYSDSQWQTLQFVTALSPTNSFDYADIGPSTQYTGVCYVAYGSDFIANTQRKITMGIETGGALTHEICDVPLSDPYVPQESLVVPDNVSCVLRLGPNVSDNGTTRSARVEYTLHVPESADYLMMHYLLAFESSGPGYHRPEDDNRFVVDVIDAEGETTNMMWQRGCDYDPTTDNYICEDNWHHMETSAYASMDWQDWTTLPLYLWKYAGTTIRLRITVASCVYDTHLTYAYIYFDDCLDGTSQPTSVAEVPAEGGCAAEKVLRNGQLIIIRDNQTYDALGRLLE